MIERLSPEAKTNIDRDALFQNSRSLDNMHKSGRSARLLFKP